MKANLCLQKGSLVIVEIQISKDLFTLLLIDGMIFEKNMPFCQLTASGSKIH